MTLFTVYDTNGEPFEVRPDVAKNLVIAHGWSLDKPAVVHVHSPDPVVEPAPEPVHTVVNAQPDEVHPVVG